MERGKAMVSCAVFPAVIQTKAVQCGAKHGKARKFMLMSKPLETCFLRGRVNQHIAKIDRNLIPSTSINYQNRPIDFQKVQHGNTANSPVLTLEIP